jgi:hypothetical protein
MYIHDRTKIKLIEKALEDKGISLSCKVCNNGKYLIEDALYQIQPGSKGSMMQYSALHSLVFIQCDNCGNVMLFNLQNLGLTEDMLSSKV